MKKFNADGGFRKDAIKEYDEHDLNNYSGQSLEEATQSLDDTMMFSEEDLDKVKAGMTLTEEEKQKIINMSR